MWICIEPDVFGTLGINIVCEDATQSTVTDKGKGKEQHISEDEDRFPTPEWESDIGKMPEEQWQAMPPKDVKVGLSIQGESIESMHIVANSLNIVIEDEDSNNIEIMSAGSLSLEATRGKHCVSYKSISN